MNIKITLLTVLTAIIFPFSLLANDAVDLPNTFMENLVNGKVNRAVDTYFATNPLISEKSQQVAFVKTQISSGFNLFGKPFAYELVLAEEFGESLKRFVFITKHENHPLVWEFYVYKPKNTWIASNMNFKDDYTFLEAKK